LLSDTLSRNPQPLFNAGVAYRDKVLEWDTVIEQKTNELARFLAGKSSTLDLMQPPAKLERPDNHELRAKILALTVSQARQLGIGKSTLHNLRRHAKSSSCFNVYGRVLKKLGGATV
jgi:hypothetical protein